MKKIKKYPKVILVGRTNVGKSSLFNRLTENTKSIVLDQEGVTRDYISEIVEWDSKSFDLIDTGGVALEKTSDKILSLIQEKVFNLLNKANLILFVCDIKDGVTHQDKKIAKILHKSNMPTILLINKIDNKFAYEQNFSEFYSLGFKKIMGISAIHGIGIADLLDNIIKVIPYVMETEERKPAYKVSIIGKPNVGKSSLMNILSKRERSIISDISGTTRETISQIIYNSENLIQISDTAGLRKQGKIGKKIETLMAKSTLSTIRTSDIVILIIDSSELRLSHQELKLLFYAQEQKKSVLLILNKIDLLTDNDKNILKHNLTEYKFILSKIPTVMTSCKNKKNINKIYVELEKSWLRRNQEFNDLEVDELVRENFAIRPFYHTGVRLKLFKIRQIKNAKIPTFQLIVNYPEWFKEAQLGFIENLLRKKFDLKGCPIEFVKSKI